ncbi:MAG: GNAT family N-acetyltransferase [Reyranellaceae bacterium]
MRLRPAKTSEAHALSELCFRSKAHWGYDAAFMEQSRKALTISKAKIRDNPVVVAVGDRVGDGERLLGVYALEAQGTTVDLDLLFVDPPAIGTGVGRALFRDAVAEARMLGGRELTVLADPHAAGFYEAMGCRFAEMRPSDAIGGRRLPLYRLTLRR